jgi:DNA polymerase (family X)
LAEGETKASVILENGFQCDFRVVPKDSLGAALIYFTGSKEHNVRLRELALSKKLTLNEYGLFKLSDTQQKKPVAGKTEQEVYNHLGLQWISPELREDRGEINLALTNKLPHLITEQDVLGDFHNHTTLSDGKNTLDEMVEAARARKWGWFFSADHSPSLTIASGLDVNRLRAKMAHVKLLNKKWKDFRVFCSSEVDILADGRLDYPDAVLAELDCVVASVHSRFKQTEEEMTERICRAIQNPHVDILGHLSGRKILKRESYALNVEAVLDVARKTGTALEINGQPERQELRDIYVKRAIELGISLALNTDAHSIHQLDHMRLAVHIARRGGAEPKHIINTMDEKSISRWLNR